MSETDFDPRQAAQALNELVGGAVPHNALLGLEVVSAAPGTAVLRLPYREELIGNPETRVLHGGAVTALLDATCGMAVFLRLERFVRIATLDLRIDYLRPALPDAELRARADCYHLTSSVAFVRAAAFQEPGDRQVASAVGTFMIFDD